MTCPGTPAGVRAGRRERPFARIRIALFTLCLAFAFLGSRGIWDPDEGRYTNVALVMLQTGDWLTPHRNDDIAHWTKPPATYWAIAASMAAFGRNPWAARLPAALAFVACTWIAWRSARRLAPGSERTAAVAYATMFLPFGAAGVITTDFLLSATQALAVLAFVEARFGPPAAARRWLVLMWLAFGASFLVKGPPGLLPLLAIAAFDWLVPGGQPRRWLPVVCGIGLLAALALPWYAVVTWQHDGLLDYFLGTEVIARVTGDGFDRNGGWLGWLKVYGPVLALGTLPWTRVLWRWMRTLPSRLRTWRHREGRAAGPEEIMLVLWVSLPLAVFCVSSSRLPLYVLPLFVPLAVLVALQLHREHRRFPRWRGIVAWGVLLLALRVASAAFSTHKDASAWADAIVARTGFRPGEVVFVEDMARYGLKLHLDAEIEKVSLQPLTDPHPFNPVFDESLREELHEAADEPDAVFVTKLARWPEVRAAISAMGYRASAVGTPYQGRVVFVVRRSRT